MAVEIEVKTPGDGKRFAKQGDKVAIHVTLMRSDDGSVLECSRAKGEPLEFILGLQAPTKLIPAAFLTEGLRRLSHGERALLRFTGDDNNNNNSNNNNNNNRCDGDQDTSMLKLDVEVLKIVPRPRWTSAIEGSSEPPESFGAGLSNPIWAKLQRKRKKAVASSVEASPSRSTKKRMMVVATMKAPSGAAVHSSSKEQRGGGERLNSSPFLHIGDDDDHTTLARAEAEEEDHDDEEEGEEERQYLPTRSYVEDIIDKTDDDEEDEEEEQQQIGCPKEGEDKNYKAALPKDTALNRGDGAAPPPPEFISLSSFATGDGEHDTTRKENVDEGIEDEDAPWVSRRYENKNRFLRLHEEILDFCRWISPSKEEHELREKLVERLRQVVIGCFGSSDDYTHSPAVRGGRGGSRHVQQQRKGRAAAAAGVSLLPFGSFATGLYLPSSDMDLVTMGVPLDADKTQLYRLAKAIRLAGITEDVEVIAKARVPIIKFKDAASGLDVDISFNQSSGLDATPYMHDEMESLPAVKPLTLVLKLFLSVRKLNEPFHGGVGSFLLQSMVISFLKIVHVRGERTFQWRSTWQKMSLGALLHAFFDFYGERLNYDTVGLKVKGGGGLFKKTKRNGWEQQMGRLALESPLDRSDIGRGAYRFSNIRRAFKYAWLALLAPQESVGKSLLSRIIRGEKITQFGKRKGQEKLHRWGGVSSDSRINPSPSSSSESSYDWSSTKKEGGKNSAYRASPNELKISLDFTSATPDGRPRRRVMERSDDKDIDSSFERKRPKAKGGRGGRGGRRQSGEGRVGRNVSSGSYSLPNTQRRRSNKRFIDDSLTATISGRVSNPAHPGRSPAANLRRNAKRAKKRAKKTKKKTFIDLTAE